MLGLFGSINGHESPLGKRKGVVCVGKKRNERKWELSAVAHCPREVLRKVRFYLHLPD